MLVYFFCTLFQFVCCIKCNAGGRRSAGIAFYAADKIKSSKETSRTALWSTYLIGCGERERGRFKWLFLIYDVVDVRTGI